MKQFLTGPHHADDDRSAAVLADEAGGQPARPIRRRPAAHDHVRARQLVARREVQPGRQRPPSVPHRPQQTARQAAAVTTEIGDEIGEVEKGVIVSADGQVAARIANDGVVDNVRVSEAHAEGVGDRSRRGVRRGTVDDETAASVLSSQEQRRL